MEIVFPGDPYAMNWIRPDYPYAEVRLRDARDAPAGTCSLRASVATVREGADVRSAVAIRNAGTRPVFTSVGDIGITLPLQDRYADARTSLTGRCTAHLFCAGTSSYVLALRMGGEPPHLGLVVTEGSLAAYSIVRDTAHLSNDRGCFVLHPPSLELQPGESWRLAWTIFPCASASDFFAQAARRSRFLRVEWDHYVLFPGESATMRIVASFPARDVRVNGVRVQRDAGGARTFRMVASSPGEHRFTVRADDQEVHTRILVKEPLARLAERRCGFIAAHQQYHGRCADLRGAYLVYDNEEHHPYYSTTDDYNAGRERVGMGVAVEQYLLALREGAIRAPEHVRVGDLERSLARYARFVRRELVDPSTGEAFNDAPRCAAPRLYNGPWYASFFLGLWELYGRIEDLRTAARLLQHYYARGGDRFYAIDLPALALVRALDRAGCVSERDDIAHALIRHARTIAQAGRHYPGHEVNYEQAIVAPAADIVLQGYALSADPQLLDAARDHVRVLEQFQGMQADYHLHEVAVRHWDGYWFGKRRCLGDTLPHYWSALTGNVFELYSLLTNDARYARRARACLRATLPLLFDDGRASCAYLFPLAVNGRPGRYYDPYANDQDWALVFALRHVRRQEERLVRSVRGTSGRRPRPVR